MQYDDSLIAVVARAMFVSRNFTSVDLSQMSTDNLPNNWPQLEYIDWSNLHVGEKQFWKAQAVTWLEDLRVMRPAYYNILVKNYLDINL